jgi:hypothetical protein
LRAQRRYPKTKSPSNRSSVLSENKTAIQWLLLFLAAAISCNLGMEIVFALILVYTPIVTTRLVAPSELLACSLTIIAVFAGFALLGSAMAVRTRTVLSRVPDVVTFIGATAFATR